MTDDALLRVGVPPRFQSATTESLTAAQTSAIRESAMGREWESVFVTGPVGTGKSYVAAALLRSAIKVVCDGRPVTRDIARWETVGALLVRIRGAFGGTGTPEVDALRVLSRVALLALDDFGADQSTEWGWSFLYNVLNERYNNFRRTLVTSNLTLAEITARDERMASRLASYSYVKLAGEDRRLGERPAKIKALEEGR